jgi:hypothetical protein
MQGVKLIGKVVFIGEKEVIEWVSKKTNKEYKIEKKEIVIEEIKEEYPQRVAITFTNDKLDLVQWIKVDDMIEAYVNFNANPYIKDGKTRYINSINCWKVNITWEPSVTNDDDLPF